MSAPHAPTMLTMSQALYARIQRHLEAVYPEEGAGALLGRQRADGTWQVVQVLPLDNQWQGPERTRRYLLPPAALLHAEEAAERAGLWLVGLYHSHPDHPPRPSAFDLRHALPNLIYLIVSVQQGRAAEARAWRLKDDRSNFEPVALQVLETA